MKRELSIKVEIEFTAEQAAIFDELKESLRVVFSQSLIPHVNDLVSNVKSKEPQFKNECLISVS